MSIRIDILKATNRNKNGYSVSHVGMCEFPIDWFDLHDTTAGVRFLNSFKSPYFFTMPRFFEARKMLPKAQICMMTAGIQ